MQLDYLVPFIDALSAAVARNEPHNVYTAARSLTSGLSSFDVQSFKGESRTDLITIKQTLDRWSADIRGENFQQDWPTMEPAVRRLIENFQPTKPQHSVPMVRDKELMKLLLLQVRDGKEPSALKLYPEPLVVYNAALLIDGGFVKGNAIQGLDGTYVSAVMTHLTNLGHELLDDIISGTTRVPPELTESLERFRKDHPDSSKAAFIMMRFGETKAHTAIVDAIRESFRPFNIQALRADDKQYHDDLLSNVLTYIYGCGMGVAVFERIEAEAFNPNVAFEVGYIIALGKPVCMLKDKTMSTLQSDLIGKLYKAFDPLDAKASIPPQVWNWVNDKGLR